MRRKHWFLVIAALLAAGGLWVGRKMWRAEHSGTAEPAIPSVQAADSQIKPGQTNSAPPRLEPPDPARRFRDFTPEQRVEFARKGHGPGG